MKVILLENVTSVGALGDVINVRPGFARNYLFPQGKAERASDEAVKRFEERRAELQKRQDALEAAMKTAHETLDGYLLQLTARASPDGNLYGSITPQLVASALNAQQLVEGLVIKRGQVALADGHIKALGEHAATVRLSPTAEAAFTISVLAESAAGAASSSSPRQEADNDSSDDNAKKDSQ